MSRIEEALNRLFVQSRGEINSRIEQISFVSIFQVHRQKDIVIALKLTQTGICG